MKSYRPNPNLDWQENLFNYLIYYNADNKESLERLKQIQYNSQTKDNITKSITFWCMSLRNQNIVFDYFNGCGSFANLSSNYNISETRIKQLIEKAIHYTFRQLLRSLKFPDYLKQIPCSEIKLSTENEITLSTEIRLLSNILSLKVCNALLRQHYVTVNDILKDSIPKLLDTPNFGNKGFKELLMLMNKLGYTTNDMQTWEKI